MAGYETLLDIIKCATVAAITIMLEMRTDNGCSRNKVFLLVAVLFQMKESVQSFVFQSSRTNVREGRHPTFIAQNFDWAKLPFGSAAPPTHLSMAGRIFINKGGEDDDEHEPEEEEEGDDEPEEENSYIKAASSEFGASDDQLLSSVNKNNSSALAYGGTADNSLSTSIDWGGALGTLRQRLDDIESGKSGNPSQALFRLMSAETPNQSIGSFIRKANPQVVQAMSGAISSLLGGLSSPQSGIEVLVKSTGDKIGSLCFQLQMTG